MKILLVVGALVLTGFLLGSCQTTPQKSESIAPAPQSLVEPEGTDPSAVTKKAGSERYQHSEVECPPEPGDPYDAPSVEVGVTKKVAESGKKNKVGVYTQYRCRGVRPGQ